MNWTAKIVVLLLAALLSVQPVLAACGNANAAQECQPARAPECHPESAAMQHNRSASCCRKSSDPVPANEETQKASTIAAAQPQPAPSAVALAAHRAEVEPLEGLSHPPAPAQALLCTFLI